MPPVVHLVLLVITAVVTYLGFVRRDVLERLIFRPEPVLLRREYYRLVSSALLHANWMHFGFNAISIWSFGGLIERYYGPLPFLLIYLASVVGGGALSLVLHRRDPSYAALGASGGACGLIFAAVFLVPGSGVSLFFIPIPIPGWLYGIVFVVGSYFAFRKKSDNIGHDAHLGGALVGLGVATLLYPQMALAQPTLFAALVVPAIAAVYLLVRFPHGISARAVIGEARQHQSNIRYQRYDESAERARKKRRLDELLDRISARGFQSLNEAEKRELDSLAQLFRR
jgi:membrane associated rhomboid family serine protease